MWKAGLHTILVQHVFPYAGNKTEDMKKHRFFFSYDVHLKNLEDISKV